MKKRRAAFLLVLVLLLLAAAAVGWRLTTREQGQERTFRLERGDIVNSIKETGRIVSSQDLKVFAKTKGSIQRLLVAVGDQVKAGARLLDYDSEAMTSRLREAELALELQEIRTRRLGEKIASGKTLHSEGIVPDAEVTELETEHKVAQLNEKMARQKVESLRLMLAKQECASPIAGTVVARFVEAGQMVLPGTPLFQIADLETLQVEFEIEDFDSYQIRVGQKAYVNPSGYYGSDRKRIAGRVSRIDPQVSVLPGTSTVKGRIELGEGVGEFSFRLGNQVDIEVVIDEKRDVNYLPLEALIQEKDRTFVLVRRGGSPERRQVRTGVSDKFRMEILDGIDASSEVVIWTAETTP